MAEREKRREEENKEKPRRKLFPSRCSTMVGVKVVNSRYFTMA